MLSPVRLSSLTLVHPTQPVEIFVSAIFLWHLVPWPSARPGGTPPSGELNPRGVANIAILDLSKAICRKRCEIGGKLVLITNRKSYMSFRLVPKSVTLNDLERPNDPYFALFHRICVYDVVVKQLLGVPRNQNLLLIFCDHINTICAIIQRLFWQNKSKQSPPLQTVVAYAHVSW